MNTHYISEEGLSLIKQFEGCKLTAYKCPAGVWTIGYGSTGVHVHEGLNITQEYAEQLLRDDLERFEVGVERVVKIEPTQSQFDALCSFAFNLGTGRLEASTLLKRVNARAFADAAAEFMKWDKAGGKALTGLTKRRAAEAALFLGKDWRSVL